VLDNTLVWHTNRTVARLTSNYRHDDGVIVVHHDNTHEHLTDDEGAEIVHAT